MSIDILSTYQISEKHYDFAGRILKEKHGTKCRKKFHSVLGFVVIFLFFNICRTF